MDKKIIMGGAAAAIVAVGAMALFAGGGTERAVGDYTFETAEVERGEVSRVISAAGAVEPVNKVDVGSEVSGKIIELFVDFNDPVTEGQVLAQIDPETFQTAVQQAEARLMQSQASVANARSAIERSEVNLDVAEKAYNRQKNLFAEQAISQAAWEQAEQNYKYAQVELQTNKVSLQSALAGLEPSTQNWGMLSIRGEAFTLRKCNGPGTLLSIKEIMSSNLANVSSLCASG